MKTTYTKNLFIFAFLLMIIPFLTACFDDAAASRDSYTVSWDNNPNEGCIPETDCKTSSFCGLNGVDRVLVGEVEYDVTSLTVNMNLKGGDVVACHASVKNSVTGLTSVDSDVATMTVNFLDPNTPVNLRIE